MCPERVESDRVALVTGSARGIGLGVAKELAARGLVVHVVWRKTENPELEALFPGRVHRADLVREDDCRRLVAEILERDGRLDGVVHAMGEYVAGPLEELSAPDFRRMLENNATSAFLLVQAAREALREARGAYVFFGCSGVESLRARREAAAYTAAKTALVVLMRSLALEEAPRGVRANMVSPGIVPHVHASMDTHELKEKVPLGRPGNEADLARAVAWLLSPESEHVTGQNIDVAGGWFL